MIAEEVKKCVEIIRKGGVVLYPTDTIWGLGCDPNNEKAIQKINEIKGRPKGKSYILLVGLERQLNHYIPEFPEVCYDLIDFSEKPLTIIYPNARNVSNLIVANDKSLGIRITEDAFCKRLTQQLKSGIVSTSANLSGKPSPKCFDDIDASIKDSVDYIVDLKKIKKMESPSSIIKIGLNGEVEIIRK